MVCHVRSLARFERSTLCRKFWDALSREVYERLVREHRSGPRVVITARAASVPAPMGDHRNCWMTWPPVIDSVTYRVYPCDSA